jgi:RNA polymerase sigma factor for flagellar operon FliA
MVVQAEEKLIWEDFQTNRSPEVREQLILQSVPLVYYMVGRLGITSEMGSDYEDIVNQGILGLIEAVDRFDPRFGTRFSTYASVRIRGKILDSLRNADWMSRSARKRARHVQQAVSSLWGQLQREPTDDEIANFLGMDTGEVQRGLCDTNLVFFSLDADVEIDQDGDGSFHEKLRDDKQENPAELFEDSDQKSELIKGIRALPEREQLILSLYYFDELTFKEIGKVLGITESRVCQLHARALINLKGVVKHG